MRKQNKTEWARVLLPFCHAFSLHQHIDGTLFFSLLQQINMMAFSIRSVHLIYISWYSSRVYVCVHGKTVVGGQVQFLVHLSPSLSLQLNNNHIREKSQINIELNALKIIKKILRFDFCFRPHLYIVPPY